jgi:hypothetical protein
MPWEEKRMNTTTHDSDYNLERQRQRLEALVQGPVEAAKQPALLAHTFRAVGRYLLRVLTAGNELSIRQRVHRGQPVWLVYDPITTQRHRFYSEADLATWLEGRYYE